MGPTSKGREGRGGEGEAERRGEERKEKRGGEGREGGSSSFALGRKNQSRYDFDVALCPSSSQILATPLLPGCAGAVVEVRRHQPADDCGLRDVHSLFRQSTRRRSAVLRIHRCVRSVRLPYVRWRPRRLPYLSTVHASFVIVTTTMNE